MYQIRTKVRNMLLLMTLTGWMRPGHLDMVIPGFRIIFFQEGTDPEFLGHDKTVGELRNLEKYQKWNFGQIKFEKIKRSIFRANLEKVRKITVLNLEKIWKNSQKIFLFPYFFLDSSGGSDKNFWKMRGFFLDSFAHIFSDSSSFQVLRKNICKKSLSYLD